MLYRLLKNLFSISSLLIYTSVAWATVEVDIKNAASQDEDQTISYFPTPSASGTAITDGFVDPGLQSFSLQVDRDDEDEGDRDNMMVLNISSNQSFSVGSGQQLVALLLVAGERSGIAIDIPIPIAAAETASSSTSATDLNDCVNQDNCQATDVVDSSSNLITPTTSYLLAARYSSGQVLSVGFYLKDLCQIASEISATIDNVCSGSTVDQPDSTESTTVTVKVEFRVANSETTYVQASGAGSDTANHQLSLHARANEQTGCTGSILYFPGDTKIKVDPDAISFSSQSGAAPVKYVVFVGNLGADATPDESGMTGTNRNHDVYGEFEIEDDEPNEKYISGFTNSTNSTTNSYGGAFLLKDAAGIIPTIDSGCEISFATNGGIQTAAVSGFLADSDCFIATAATGSMKNWIVSTLRQFRDQVLVKFEFGRSFVRWYYAHSPLPAMWIAEHGWARVGVTVFLLPLTFFAALLVYPQFLALLMAMALLAFFRLRRLKIHAE